MTQSGKLSLSIIIWRIGGGSQIAWGPTILLVVIDWVIMFNVTLNKMLAITWRSVYWWRTPEYQEKTTHLPHVTDKL